MKPNWKAYAKEAYRRGYERGKREVSGWIPSEILRQNPEGMNAR